MSRICRQAHVPMLQISLPYLVVQFKHTFIPTQVTTSSVLCLYVCIVKHVPLAHKNV